MRQRAANSERQTAHVLHVLHSPTSFAPRYSGTIHLGVSTQSIRHSKRIPSGEEMPRAMVGGRGPRGGGMRSIARPAQSE